MNYLCQLCENCDIKINLILLGFIINMFKENGRKFFFRLSTGDISCEYLLPLGGKS